MFRKPLRRRREQVPELEIINRTRIKQFPQIRKESEQVEGVGGVDFGILAANVLACGTHARCDDLAVDVHGYFDKDFVDALDFGGLGPLEVGEGEFEAEIVEAVDDGFVGLFRALVMGR